MRDALVGAEDEWLGLELLREELQQQSEASVRELPALQPLEKFDRIPRREDHGARLGDGVLDLDDQAPKKSERPLILDGQPVKAGMGIR